MAGMLGREARVAAALGAAAAALIARALYKDALFRSRFAQLPHAPPPHTELALRKHRWHRLRHAVLRRVVSPRALERKFDAIRAAFAPQQVDYSNTAYGRSHWALSCFMEYSNGVAAGKVDLSKGQPMMALTAEILGACDEAFLSWCAASARSLFAAALRACAWLWRKVR